MSTAQTASQFKSSQGQRAGALRLSFDDMTKNEQMVVVALAREGRPVLTIREIMVECNWHHMPGGKAQGNSRVRNTLRRLVRANWVTHPDEVGDGKYRLSTQALARLRRIAAKELPAGEAPAAQAL